MYETVTVYTHSSGARVELAFDGTYPALKFFNASGVQLNGGAQLQLSADSAVVRVQESDTLTANVIPA